MSDKPYQSLAPFDRELREAFPVTDADGIQLRIEKIVGFELFNTREYHNYETWSDGYRIVGPLLRAWVPWTAFEERARSAGVDDATIRALWNIATGSMQGLLRVEKEDLDDALATWLGNREKVRAILSEHPAGPNQRTRLAVLGLHLPREEEVVS